MLNGFITLKHLKVLRNLTFGFWPSLNQLNVTVMIINFDYHYPDSEISDNSVELSPNPNVQQLYIHNCMQMYTHTNWRIKDAAVPTIPTVATGARALIANARAEAVDANNASVSK